MYEEMLKNTWTDIVVPFMSCEGEYPISLNYWLFSGVNVPKHVSVRVANVVQFASRSAKSWCQIIRFQMSDRKEQSEWMKFCFLLKKTTTEAHAMSELWRPLHYFLHHDNAPPSMPNTLLWVLVGFWHLNGTIPHASYSFGMAPSCFLIIPKNE